MPQVYIPTLYSLFSESYCFIEKHQMMYISQ